jgi:hypothetical protein
MQPSTRAARCKRRHRRGTMGMVSFMVLALMGLVPHMSKAQSVPTPGRTFQDGMRVGIGYSALLPDVALGGGGWVLLPGRAFGFFAEGKRTATRLGSHEDYCPPTISPCTVAEARRRWNDVELRDIDEYAILNVGIVYALNRELAFLVGGGRAQHRVIREFVEALEPGEAFRVSQGGAYFVPLDEDVPWTTQLVVGMLFRANSSFSLRAGYETAARGMSVGAYWTPGR